MLLALLAASTLAVASDDQCEGPLQGSWSVAWSHIDDGRFETYAGVIGETKVPGAAPTSLVFFVTATSSGIGSYAINVWQDCSQTLQDGVIRMVCEVQKRQGGAYGADDLRVVCTSPDTATAALLSKDGEVVIDGMRLNRLSPPLRAPRIGARTN